MGKQSSWDQAKDLDQFLLEWTPNVKDSTWLEKFLVYVCKNAKLKACTLTYVTSF